MKKIICIAVAAATITGCASTEVKDFVNGEHSAAINQMSAKKASNDNAEPIILPVLETPYLGRTSIASADATTEFPRILRSNNLVHFDMPYGVSAESFGRLVAEEAGIPVKVNVAPPAQVQGQQVTPKSVNLSILPPMKWLELMDLVTAQLGVDYEMDENVLNIAASFRHNYPFIATESSVEGTINLGKSSTSQVGATGSSNTSTSGNFTSKIDSTTTNKSDPWTDAMAALKMMAGDTNVVANKSAGFISVDCSKACHRAVKKYLDEANFAMTRQVLLRVVEVTVASTKTGQSGVNWNLVYQNMTASKNYALSFASPASLVGGAAGNVGLNIFNPINGTNAWNGSEALFQAVSAASKVVDHKPYDLIALNNKPATLANTDQQSYIVSTNIIPSTGLNSAPLFSQNVGYVTYGQLLQMTPTVYPGGKVAIRFGLDDTKLKNIVAATKQGDVDKISLSGVNLLNETIVQAGSTVVLASFKRSVSKINEQGLFANQRMGSEAGDSDVTETLIMVTPILSSF